MALSSSLRFAIEPGAAHPFWSPDGRYIGFFAGNKLMKIAATGGPIAAVADAPNSRGRTWSANDMIVFAPSSCGIALVCRLGQRYCLRVSGV